MRAQCIPYAVALTDAVQASAAAPDEVEEEVVARLVARDLRRLMREQLTATEQQVLALHFGLDDERIHTLREIGDHLGVTAPMVLKHERRALGKLRVAMTTP